MSAYYEGQIRNVCLGRQKKIDWEKGGFELMWRQVIMQIEYSRYVRNGFALKIIAFISILG